MSFLTIINNSEVLCVADRVVLTKEQVREVSALSELANELRQVREDEETRVTSAKNEGFRKGYNDGVKEAVEDVKREFDAYMNRIVDRVTETQTMTREEILDLALQITRKIAVEIGNDDMILGIASNALKNYRQGETVKIKVNTRYVDSLKSKFDQMYGDGGNLQLNFEVIPDRTIGELDCIIVSDVGVTEASFDRQIESLERKLKSALQSTN